MCPYLLSFAITNSVVLVCYSVHVVQIFCAIKYTVQHKISASCMDNSLFKYFQDKIINFFLLNLAFCS